MIVFKTLKFKNLLSFGNTPTVIDLNRSPSTLIVGQSGHGKSTIIEALCFSLFGKPFRKITKKNLVNTINNKDCVTEVEFSIEDVTYKVVRGIKPDIFEIQVNGELLNQDPTVRDYQEYLEKNILKMSYKTFTQIVVLGYANYTPFMMLNASERRSMVDELLDTNIFSKMMEVLKIRMSTIKTELSVISSNIDAYTSSLEILKSNLSKIKESEDDKRSQIEKEIEELKINVSKLTDRAKEKRSEIEHLHNSLISDDVESKLNTFRNLLSKIEHNKETVEKGIQFFTENSQCPTCNQDITNEHREDAILQRKYKLDELELGISKLTKNINDAVDTVNQNKQTLKTINNIERELVVLNSNISNYQTVIQQRLNELSKKPNNVIEDTSLKINELESYIRIGNEKKAEFSEQRLYLEVAQTLLKDDGIKSLIIKEYIPIINQLVNMYLDSMNFHMRFVLDENFEEQILSRFRDELKFQSLSQGEQSRLSLAIMLAWRKLAELRNSVNVNILWLDETLDATINAADLESVVGLLNEVSKDNNIFVISHKPDQLADKIYSVIEIEKQGNFSRIK